DDLVSRRLALSRSLFSEFLNKRACIADGGRCGKIGGKTNICCGSNCFGKGPSGGVCGNPLIDGPLHGFAKETSFNDFDTIGSSGISFPKIINVRKWSWVNSIEITYQAADGTSRAGLRRGGDNGVDCIFTLDPDERIVKVEGAYINHLDFLQFTSNKGRKSERCGGGSNDNYFTEQHPGYVLSYISGYYGWYLNGIQFHWVREEIQYIISTIKYDTSKLTKQNLGKPRTVYLTTLVNKSPIEQTQSYTYEFKTSDSSSWSLTAGYTVSLIQSK
ncbi:MAG: hypothetical protein IT281_10185, partial [Ignavibacteria bacterium]|nr:hypothetical protein [Ignavibacteria bacterium]